MPYDVTENLSNLQVVEVGVTGPGRARRLFLISGHAQAGMGISANTGQSQTQRQVVIAKVGPELTAEQFVRASATASVSSWRFSGAPTVVQVTIEDVDADYDDESGRVAIEVELSVNVTAPGSGSASVQLQGLGFSVQITATE